MERFGVNVKEEPLPQVGAYDEDRSLSLEPDGMPTVQSDIVGATNTNTFAEKEPSDADRSAWEDAIAGVGTRTTAERDKDHWVV